MFSLNRIGFHTLSDERAKQQHHNLMRCEMIVTEACNFCCPYCRGVSAYSRDCSGHIDHKIASFVINQWTKQGLQNIRFSGGEPTLYPRLVDLVRQSKNEGIKGIAISTNGSRNPDIYSDLLQAGVNDFSISLDACCAEDVDKMSGRKGHFENIIENITWLSKETYVTVGIVLTEETRSTVVDVVEFAHDIGVNDIRIITAAQYNGRLNELERVSDNILEAHPILAYRVHNLLHGRNVRGIKETDTNKCHLVKDDSVVAGKWHFPCVIHMREGGEPISEVTENMPLDRLLWSHSHNTHNDPICKKNCLDCLVDYNNKVEEYSSYL